MDFQRFGPLTECVSSLKLGPALTGGAFLLTDVCVTPSTSTERVMTAWTHEMRDRLKQYHNEKRTYAEIAGAINKEFGTSVNRNAISGKVSRLGMSMPFEAAQRAVAKRGRVQSTQKVVTVKLTPGKHRPRPVLIEYDDLNPKPPEPPPVAEAATQEACTLFDLKDGVTCRWPLWGEDPQPGEMLFCGQTPQKGSYCGFHHTKSINHNRPGRVSVKLISKYQI